MTAGADPRGGAGLWSPEAELSFLPSPRVLEVGGSREASRVTPACHCADADFEQISAAAGAPTIGVDVKGKWL